jgi:hypothetical protein
MSLKCTRRPAAPVGPLIETFVLGELSRQLTFTDQPVRLYHYETGTSTKWTSSSNQQPARPSSAG